MVSATAGTEAATAVAAVAPISLQNSLRRIRASPLIFFIVLGQEQIGSECDRDSFEHGARLLTKAYNYILWNGKNYEGIFGTDTAYESGKVLTFG
jgi:hypothetical protein